MGADIRLFSSAVTLGDAKITSILDPGFFSYRRGWSDIPHEHSAAELIFLVKGSGSLFIGDKEYFLSPNSLVVVSPGQVHRMGDCSGDALFFCIRAVLAEKRTGDLPPERAYGELAKFFCSPSGFSVLREAEALISHMEVIRYELGVRAPCFRERAGAVFTFLYSDLVRILKKHPAEGEPPPPADFAALPEESGPGSRACGGAGEAILDYFFQRQYMNALSIGDLAKSLGMSVSHTHRLVKRVYGMSFIEKLVRARIGAAKKLLCETEFSAEQIAERVGYSSYNGLFTAFKRQTGISPSEFRRQSRAPRSGK